MFKNYLKVAIRNLLRQKRYSVINIFGLAIGMAVAILILLWVQNELGFDKFHKNIDDLYIVGSRVYMGNEIRNWSYVPPAVGPALKADYPEVLNAVRLDRISDITLRYRDRTFNENILAVDPSLLEMFTFPLLQGERTTALASRYSVVLTERVARKYFGGADPMGKIIRLNNAYDFLVTGVLNDIPENSSIKFDILVPIAFCEELTGKPDYLNIWDNYSFRTFVQLGKGSSYQTFSNKITHLITNKKGWRFGEPYLRPFSQLHLHYLGYGGGRIQEIHTFIIIAFFILLIASFNFMNLTTARSGKRSKEIGLRKVVGASRHNLIKQFYSECILQSMFSFIIALILVQTLLPVFNTLSGKRLTFDFISNPTLIPLLLGVVFFTGLLAGSYPSMFMAAFQPSLILKGNWMGSRGKTRSRKILVIIQFVLSIALIASTSIISRQLQYMQHKNLGFEKEQLLYIPLKKETRKNWLPAKEAMLENPNIVRASLTSGVPTGIYNNNTGWNWEGKNPDTDPLVTKFFVDFDMLETFGMKMKEGNWMSRDFISGPTITGGNIIINETFAEITGLKNPVGARISNWNYEYTIMGVIRDFHFQPLYQDIEPMAIMYDPDKARFLFLRIRPESISRSMAHIERVYRRFMPGFPLEYHFLDDEFAQLYQNEQNIGSLITTFTILAIIISCLGLFGLAAFMAELRTKEIGVRKVLGASDRGIILLLSQEFAKWVLLANVFAWPLAYIFIRNWLQNFAYHIKPGLDSFLLSGLLALTVALITVSIQAVRAARSKPVDSLRHQ